MVASASDTWPANISMADSQRSAMPFTASDGTAMWLVWATQPYPRGAPTVIYHHGPFANYDRYWERASPICCT